MMPEPDTISLIHPFAERPRVLCIGALATQSLSVVADIKLKTASDPETVIRETRAWMPEVVVMDHDPERISTTITRQIRMDPDIASVPVVLVSPAVSPEVNFSHDYLTVTVDRKLLATTVWNYIALSRAKKSTETEFYNLFRQSPAHIHVMKGPEHVLEFFHPLGRAFTNGRDLTGLRIREALPEMEGQGFFELIDSVYQTGNPVSLKEAKAVINKDGAGTDEHYFNISYLPWRNTRGEIQGVLQFSFEVTDHVKARQSIEEAEAKLQHAIDLADLGTWHISLADNHVDYSPRVADWWGLSPNGDSLEKIISCIHPDDQAMVAQAVQIGVEKTGSYEASYRLINARTGQERFIHANGRVFYKEGKPVRMSGIVRDVTLIKMTEKELARQVSLRTAELEKVNEDLKRTNENLRQFAYVASHDLQEPLRKIQTFSEMIKDRINDRQYVDNYLTRIDNSAARMSALIRDVLLYSQIDADTEMITQVDMNEVLEGIQNDFELLISKKNARIKADHLPTVRGSKMHYHQLLSNLISNAIKFSEDDPLVEITCKMVQGEQSADGRPFYRFQVRDHGIGFEPEYADKIFGLFTRLHNRRDFSGTGIGLAICKKIVEFYGGSITAESIKGKGSTFIFELPA